MKLGTMLWDVIGSLFRRPVTQNYPAVRQAAPERLRGKLQWNPEKCTGCSLCAKDCPSNAIEVLTIDRARRQFVIRYHMDRCTFCAQCVANCRFKCMGMSAEQWELAALKKEPFELYYGEDEHVDLILGRLAEEAASAEAQTAG
jgi:formate hydrogenlyase subunit 6/NADH:ubiquinone oxidoreductase subunit I